MHTHIHVPPLPWRSEHAPSTHTHAPHTHPRLQQYAREARVQYSETHKDLNGLGTFAKLPMMERLLDRLSDVATPVSEQVY